MTEESLLKWFPMPQAFLIDMERVNIKDWLHSWRQPGTVIRVQSMDGDPIIPIPTGSEKFYPIEDEL